MRAAVYRGPGDLRVEEVPTPEVARGEMLVRVDACGVCGTDVKKVKKGFLSPPRIFGHEIAGTVARLGSGVSRFQEGQRVVLHHHIPCRACFFCEAGLHAQCAVYKQNGTSAGFEPAGGGYAEYVKASDWIVQNGAIAIPDGVRADEASFVEPVNTCLKAVRKLRLTRETSVLVVGQGPIGLLLTQLVKREGATVLASDTLADRLALARSFGALAVFDAAAQDVPAGCRAAAAYGGVDCAIVAAPGQRALDQAIESVRPGGTILIFAATSPGETAEIDFGRLCSSEKQILTSYSASVEIQDEAAQAVFAREVRVLELISHRLPLEKAPEAFALAESARAGVLKVILEMRA